MKSEAKEIDGAAPSAYGSGGLDGRKNTLRAQRDVSASDPGPKNLPLNRQNPNSNLPPATDHGTVPPVWYSFDLVHRRMQEGGCTHQVTERELPSSKEMPVFRCESPQATIANSTGILPTSSPTCWPGRRALPSSIPTGPCL
jgi:hypothetical protein